MSQHHKYSFSTSVLQSQHSKGPSQEVTLSWPLGSGRCSPFKLPPLPCAPAPSQQPLLGSRYLGWSPRSVLVLPARALGTCWPWVPSWPLTPSGPGPSAPAGPEATTWLPPACPPAVSVQRSPRLTVSLLTLPCPWLVTPPPPTWALPGRLLLGAAIPCPQHPGRHRNPVVLSAHRPGKTWVLPSGAQVVCECTALA